MERIVTVIDIHFDISHCVNITFLRRYNSVPSNQNKQKPTKNRENWYFIAISKSESKTNEEMLYRWILVHRRLSGRHRWLGFTNYSTQRTEIETVVRSELSECQDQILHRNQFYNNSGFIGGFTNEAATKLVDKNRFLLQIQPNEMKKSFKTLRKLNFQTSDIKTHPRLLLQSEFQLINNFQRLQEVGFLEVTAYRLANVKKIMSKSMHFNQCFNFLPSNLNVLQSVFAVAKVPIEPFDENAYDREMKLEAIHRIALRQYMLKQIEYTSLDIDEIWHYFPALKMRSLQSIDKSARLLETAYNTRVKHLPKFILNMQPEEIEELLDTATICGTDVKKIMTLAPKCNLTRIKEIQTICWSYKIPDYALAYSPKLFYVNFNTLRERLNLISKLKQANEFFQHVAIGKVILCIDRVKAYVESKKMDFDAIFNDTFVE